MNILVTGDRGFIAGYLIKKLLDKEHIVVGVDNDWKYGARKSSFEDHPNYTHYKLDAKNQYDLLAILYNHEIEVFVMGAAIIGGISLFHKLPYTLLSENEKITCASFDAAIKAYKHRELKKIIAISSSMVFENTNIFPSSENNLRMIPPPSSTYGFQKLAVEYFCYGAFEEHELPYVIVRPFNAVGTGEIKAVEDSEIMSGNIKLSMSHVIPDLITKIYKRQNPLHILGLGNQIRHFTNAKDIAEGIYKCIITDEALMHDFNISISRGHTILEVAKTIWEKISCLDFIRNIESIKFNYVCDPPFLYDVKKRIPDVTRAKQILGFEAKITLEETLDEIIPWYIDAIDNGLM